MFGQLGKAQNGLAQLGAYNFLAAPAASPTVMKVLINSETLNIIVLPNYYEMMGRFQVFNDLSKEILDDSESSRTQLSGCPE